VAASKFKPHPRFGKNAQGHIGLQDHGNVVAFRNIKIRCCHEQEIGPTRLSYLASEFVGDVATGIAFTIVPRTYWARGRNRLAPSDKLNIACIGVGGMARTMCAAWGRPRTSMRCATWTTAGGGLVLGVSARQAVQGFPRDARERRKNIDASRSRRLITPTRSPE